MALIPEATLAHYAEIQRLQLLAIKAGRVAWGRIEPQFIVDSWARAASQLQPLVEATQLQAATSGAAYGAATLAEQGTWVAPQAFVNPQAFAGAASDGRSLATLLQSPAFRTLDAIDTGMDVANALKIGRSNMDALMSTVVADAGRQAAGVDTATRKGVGYVRMLNPPSCSRCTILAGKRFRWNDGFLRHPRCDCVHVETTLSLEAARAEGLIDDPYEYFNSLSKEEQDRIFTKGGAEAIRDGSDIYRVENARRGRAGMLTTEGTGKRGFARDLKGARLTPEGIYRQAGSREEALELLERHGYILPGGQVPGGSIRGWDYEGYGALGRGGTRVGARTQIDIDRATGTQSRYSMTEAQRRLYDSELNYREVLAGRNPYGKGPLTPDIAAMAEKDYRRWLASGGQVFEGAPAALRFADVPTSTRMPTPDVTPPTTAAALDYADMADDDLMAEMDRLLEVGDMDGFERVAAIVDSRDQAAANVVEAAKAWEPDPWDFDNPETYEWYARASVDEQDAFIAGLRNQDDFWRGQYTFDTGKRAAPSGLTEKQMHAEYDLWLEAEQRRIIETTGMTDFLTHGAKLTDQTDLWRVNDATAMANATEELKWYWTTNGGRMTYGRFKLTYSNAGAAREAMLKGVQQW